MPSDILDVSGTPDDQQGYSPDSEAGADSPKNAPFVLPTKKQYEAGADNRQIENISLVGSLPAAAIAIPLAITSDNSDLDITKAIVEGTALGNLVALLSIPFVRYFARKYYHTGIYNVYVGQTRCTPEEILQMEKNDILIYRDQDGKLCYIVKGVGKKSFVEGKFDKAEFDKPEIEKTNKDEQNSAFFDELINQSQQMPADVITPVSGECKLTFLKLTAKRGHTYSGRMSSNPLYRVFRTLAKIFGQVGVFLSYFIGGDNPAKQRLTSFLLTGLLAVVGGLLAIPYYLISGKFPNWKIKYNLTGLEGWSKFIRTAQAIFTLIGQFIGGIIIGALKNSGAAATSFGISFWSSVVGLGGVLLTFIAIPLINFFFRRKDEKTGEMRGILTSRDKNKFRNNYPRSGALAFGAMGALVGLPFGGLALGAPVMATIFSAAFAVVGAVVFSVFGKKIHDKLHPPIILPPQRPGEAPREKSIDIENSWDYVGRSSGSVFGFIGAAIACMLNPAAALMWAPVGAAIAGGIGWGLGILAMRKARSMPGNKIEKRAETLPWTQRITMGANIGSTLGSAIGVAVGMAGFILAGPASVILAVSLFGAIGSVIGGVAGVLYEPLARRLIWQSIKSFFGKNSSEEARPVSQLQNSPSPDHSNSRTASLRYDSPEKKVSRSPSPPEMKSTTQEVMLASGSTLVKPVPLSVSFSDTQEPRFKTHRPFNIQTHKTSKFFPVINIQMEDMLTQQHHLARTTSEQQPKQQKAS